MLLLSCGSNGSGQLALGDADDRSHFTRSQFDPSIDTDELDGAEIVDIASSAHHSLLLLRVPLSTDNACSTPSSPLDRAVDPSGRARWRYELFGVGTNTYGQLGRRCALRDEDAPAQSWSRWRRLNLLPRSMREVQTGGVAGEEWEPRCVGTTWTTSFVVYRRQTTAASASSGSGGLVGMEEILVASGSNDFGELGVSPRILSSEDEGTTTDLADDGPQVIDIGLRSGDTVQSITCGQRHILCLVQSPDGGQRVVGWGASRKGELDPTCTPTTISSVDTGVNSTSAVDPGKGKGKAKAGSKTARARTALPHTLQLDLYPEERITKLGAGASHSVALLSSGRLLAWGSDAKGQITSLDGLEAVQAVACTWNGTYLRREGRVWSQGSNTHSQLVRDRLSSTDDAGEIDWAGQDDVSTADEKVDRLVCGTEHILITSPDGALWAGGWNEHGNLGLGDEVDRKAMERVDLGGGRVKGVWAGCAASWAWVDR